MNCLEFRSVGVSCSVNVSAEDNEYGIGANGYAEATVDKSTDKKALVQCSCGRSVYNVEPYVAMRQGLCGRERFTLTTNSPLFGTFSTTGEYSEELYLAWYLPASGYNPMPASGQHPLPLITNPDSFNPLPNDPYYARAKKIYQDALSLYPLPIYLGTYQYLEPGQDPLTGDLVVNPTTGIPVDAAGYYFIPFAYGNLSDAYNDGSTAALLLWNTEDIIVGTATLSLQITT